MICPTLTRWTVLPTFPIVITNGKVRNTCHESNHRFSKPPKGPANTCKWESYSTQAEIEQRNPDSGVPDAGRDCPTDQGSEGRSIPTKGSGHDRDCVPSWLKGFRVDRPALGSDRLEGWNNSCEPTEGRHSISPSIAGTRTAGITINQIRIALRVLFRTRWTNDCIQRSQDRRQVGSGGKDPVLSPSAYAQAFDWIQVSQRRPRHTQPCPLPGPCELAEHSKVHGPEPKSLQRLFQRLAVQETTPRGQRLVEAWAGRPFTHGPGPIKLLTKLFSKILFFVSGLRSDGPGPKPTPNLVGTKCPHPRTPVASSSERLVGPFNLGPWLLGRGQNRFRSLTRLSFAVSSRSRLSPGGLGSGFNNGEITNE
jgi:hypothetical protein